MGEARLSGFPSYEGEEGSGNQQQNEQAASPGAEGRDGDRVEAAPQGQPPDLGVGLAEEGGFEIGLLHRTSGLEDLTASERR